MCMNAGLRTCGLHEGSGCGRSLIQGDSFFKACGGQAGNGELDVLMRVMKTLPAFLNSSFPFGIKIGSAWGKGKGTLKILVHGHVLVAWLALRQQASS